MREWRRIPDCQMSGLSDGSDAQSYKQAGILFKMEIIWDCFTFSSALSSSGTFLRVCWPCNIDPSGWNCCAWFTRVCPNLWGSAASPGSTCTPSATPAPEVHLLYMRPYPDSSEWRVRGEATARNTHRCIGSSGCKLPTKPARTKAVTQPPTAAASLLRRGGALPVSCLLHRL